MANNSYDLLLAYKIFGLLSRILSLANQIAAVNGIRSRVKIDATY